MRARGLNRDGQGVGLHGTKNNARSPEILGEQIVPRGHFVGVHQQQSARDVAGFDEIFGLALAHINDGHILMSCQSWCPRHRNNPYVKLFWRGDTHSGEALAPGSRNRKVFRVDIICARSFEGCDTPIDGLAHSQRAGYPATDLIGEALQVGFER